MDKKNKPSSALKGARQNSKLENVNLKYRLRSGYIREMSREEKIREAGKPLYLRRYE